MKKLWDNYSYAMILLLLSLSLSFILLILSSSQDDYQKITVSQGDSLWKISEQYAAQNSLTQREFVNWVKKHNPNTGDRILPGEEIFIPVLKEAPGAEELASAPEK